MKSKLWKAGTLATIGVLMLLSATSAYAQTTTRFNVPFEFLAGELRMPAGQYLVKMDFATRIVSLRHESGLSAMCLRVIPSKRSLDPVQEGMLEFKAYESANVLARVWTRGFSDAGELPVSKIERELARTERAGKTIQVAFVPAK